MADPKRNTAFSFVMGLVDSAARPAFKASPTLAAGDFKVSTDGSALANLTTLPTVIPAGSRLVLVSLSAAEMNGDRIVVQAADAVGAEWDEAIITLDTTVVTVDDLVRAATPGNLLAVNGAGAVAVGAGGITAASFAADAIDANAFALAAAHEIADALLKRDLTLVTGEAARSMLNAIRKLMNKWAIAGATLTVFKEDDISPAFTQAVTTTPGADDVITGLDTA
jgi:hypothetical protein